MDSLPSRLLVLEQTLGQEQEQESKKAQGRNSKLNSKPKPKPRMMGLEQAPGQP